MSKVSLLLIVIAFYLVCLNKFIGIFMADVYYTASKGKLAEMRVEEARLYVTRAVELNHEEPSYYRHKAKVLLAELSISKEEKIRDDVMTVLTQAQALNPHNLTTLRNIIPLYYFLAVGNMDGPSGPDNFADTYFPVTRDYYSNLKNTYPNDLGMYADVAKYQRKLGLEEDFRDTKERAALMRPDVVEWHEAFK